MRGKTDMSNILTDIVAHKRREVDQLRQSVPFKSFEASLNAGTDSFFRALSLADSGSDLRLIAEIKPKSPSSGILKQEIDISPLIQTYTRHAAAISVLTDQQYFGGSFELLKSVKRLTERPLLCKDFILEAYQIYLARYFGADAVLLIVKILEDKQLSELLELANQLGMTAVVEVQTQDETLRALASNAQCLLINNRDLSTLAIDLGTTERLIAMIPKQITTISASGISTRSHIEYLSRFTSNFLIGSSLMKANDIESLFEELQGGRSSTAANQGMETPYA
jgi:indole-3-glycerol phosphate synthase